MCSVRHRSWVCLLVIAVGLLASSAGAQPAEGGATACAELRQSADEAFVSGDDELAAQRYALLTALCGPHAPAAAELARLTALRAKGPPSIAGRLELGAFQTLFGFVDGALFGFSLIPYGSPLPIVAGLAEAALRGALSVTLTSRGLDSGQALAINSGAFWGHLYPAFGFYTFARNVPYPGVLTTFGSALGTVAGIAIASRRPDAGSVSFANSMGVWSLVFAYWFIGTAASRDAEWKRFFGISALLSGGALFTGAMLAPILKPSRGQVLLADLGALIGTVGGTLLLVALQVDPRRHGALYRVPPLAFAAGGAAAGVLVHRTWASSPGVGEAGLTLSVLPVTGGGLSVVAGGRL